MATLEHKTEAKDAKFLLLRPRKPSAPLKLKSTRPPGRTGKRNPRVVDFGKMTLPPTRECTVILRHTYRFTVASAISAQSITAQTVAGACGGTCYVVNSVLLPWASTLRIRRITIWPGLTGSPVTADITWATDGTLFSKDEFQSTTIPSGVTVEKAISSTPPPQTLGRFWQAAGDTSSLATLSAPAGSVIDCTVEYTLANQNSPTSIGIVTGVIGTIYYLALDGPGSNKIKPVGLTTTA